MIFSSWFTPLLIYRYPHKGSTAFAETQIRKPGFYVFLCMISGLYPSINICGYFPRFIIIIAVAEYFCEISALIITVYSRCVRCRVIPCCQLIQTVISIFVKERSVFGNRFQISVFIIRIWIRRSRASRTVICNGAATMVFLRGEDTDISSPEIVRSFHEVLFSA